MGIALKHLSEHDIIKIAENLFTVTEKDEARGEMHGLCPIHQETNPSFSYNYKEDKYHCFSCGASGNLIRLWTENKKLSQKDGFKGFCEEYAIPLEKSPDKKSPSEKSGNKDTRPDVFLTTEQTLELMRQAWDMFPELTEEWLQRLEEKRGWTRECIKRLDLRLQTWRLDKKTGTLKEISKPEKVAIPIRDEFCILVNIRLYKPGAKQYKIISFAKQTGDSRLFPGRPPYVIHRNIPIALFCIVRANRTQFVHCPDRLMDRSEVLTRSHRRVS